MLTDAGGRSNAGHRRIKGAADEEVCLCVFERLSVCVRPLAQGGGADPPRDIPVKFCVVVLCGVVRCFEGATGHRQQSIFAPGNRPSLTKFLPRAFTRNAHSCRIEGTSQVAAMGLAKSRAIMPGCRHLAVVWELR